MVMAERSDNNNDKMVMAMVTTKAIAITMVIAERSDNNDYGHGYGRAE